MREGKHNPTLFDKLTRSDRVTSILDEGRTDLQDASNRAAARPTIEIDRYTESAVRATVRRELGWLLNTVRLEASYDLTNTPQVKTSVLNYGLPDLTGRALTATAVDARAREIQDAIRTFEPRLDPSKVVVTATPGVGSDNAVAFVIQGDIVSAVRALPVQFFANVEVETGEAVVSE